MGYQTWETIERRRRILRIVLFIIILGTLPFYCAGFLLLALPRTVSTRPITTPVTSTPIGSDLIATNTPRPTLGVLVTTTSLSPLLPTPRQFNPPARVFPTATFYFFPTATDFIFIPTSTLAPSLTPYPTEVPPPTVTPTPLPTDLPPTEAPPTAEPPTAEPPTEVPPTTEVVVPADSGVPTQETGA